MDVNVALCCCRSGVSEETIVLVVSDLGIGQQGEAGLIVAKECV